MAAAYVQSISVNDVSAGTTTSKQYASNCTNKSLLYATVYWTDGTSTCTMSDATNGAWTAIGTPTRGSGGLAGLSAQSFYTSNTGTTALTVGCSMTGSVSNRGLAIHEYTGVSVLESHNEQMIAAGTTIASPSLTPAASSDLALSWVVCAGHVNSLGGGFTLRENANWGGNGTADIVSPTGGTPVSASWVTSAVGNIAATAIFSAAASITSFLVYGHTGLDRIANIEAWLSANYTAWLPATSTGLDRLANLEAFLTANSVNSVTFLPYGKTGTDRLWNIESYLLSATSSNG